MFRLKELLLKIRALLSRLAARGGENPLAAAAAVSLSLMEEGDLFAGGPVLAPAGAALDENPVIGPADPAPAAAPPGRSPARRPAGHPMKGAASADG